MCIDTPITSVLMYLCVMTHYHYIIKKTIAQRVRTSMSYLTTITLIEVMIMANSYDSACLRAEQSKLFKFYDLSTAQVIQTTATTERQARKNLGKQSLIFIARIRITPIIERARTWGDYNHE
ncbi:host cell division inhibitor Icd-like protein [Gilliamella apicola]